MQVTPIPRWNSTAANPVDDNAYTLITEWFDAVAKRNLIWILHEAKLVMYVRQK